VSAIAKFLLLLALIVALSLGFLFHAMTEEDQRSAKREQDWMTFSQRNHCRIVRESSFWEPSTLWQCDGNFQVKRYPN
jgi:hypothetical protein